MGNKVRYFRYAGRRIEEMKGYIFERICVSPKRRYGRSTAYMNELYAIVSKRLKTIDKRCKHILTKR